MYKIFTIFIAVIVTSCLAQRAVRYRNKRIPYEDDDYREGEYDDDRPNDIREMTRPSYDHAGRFNQLHDIRQQHYDVGGGRDPPVVPAAPSPALSDYGYRGYPYQRPSPLSPYGPLALQQQQQQQPQQLQQPQPAQPVQPVQPGQPSQALGGQAYDGGRANAFGYNPYGQYTYNPYGYRPGYYGWGRPSQAPAAPNPWNTLLNFPFNLLGLGGASPNSGYRPWWSGNRWGLFF